MTASYPKTHYLVHYICSTHQHRLITTSSSRDHRADYPYP